MENQNKNNQHINSNQDEISAEKADEQAKGKPANDGFKTGNKSNGYTWQTPMDEQAFDGESLSEDSDTKEEG